ncbi:tetratricopeptide repeat protein [bacterium]|nr:tetratricopeptide repeat protein [bacterium]
MSPPLIRRDAEPACRPLLGLALIVRDGGRRWTDLLDAALEWVDEIVVGDTGSRDGSDGQAARRGCRVFPLPWTDDFSAARNAVLERCRARWILVLDADEILCRADWQALRAWVEVGDSAGTPVAGTLTTRNYLAAPYGRRGWAPVPDPDPHGLPEGAPAPGYVPTCKVRVFPNDPRIRFRGAIHETVESSLWEAHVTAVDLPWPVHHFGYLDEDPAKARHYLSLAHRKTTEQPHDAQAWAELAECALKCGEATQARVAIDRSLVLQPGHPDRALTAGWLRLEAGELAEAEDLLARVMSHHEAGSPLVAEAAHLRAQIALRRDDAQRSARLLAVAIRLFPANGHFQNTLGTLHLSLGRPAPAREAFLRAAAALPGVAAPCRNLALLHAHLGDDEQAAVWQDEADQRSALRPACARQDETPAGAIA